MYNKKKILAIIPARGGSKGLSQKNIKLLLGKPLIGWTIEQAKSSKYIDEIHVSTDDREIADIAEKFDVKIPQLRPANLALDSTSSMDVVEYIIELYSKNSEEFDIIILLEPTSPLRKIDDIDNAIELLMKNDQSDGLISVGGVQTEHPLSVKRINEARKLEPYFESTKKIYQRQQADKAYFPYGVIYMIKTDIFKQKKAFYTENVIPYFIERWQNYEIDDIYDFICVESILKAKIEKLI